MRAIYLDIFMRDQLSLCDSLFKVCKLFWVSTSCLQKQSVTLTWWGLHIRWQHLINLETIKLLSSLALDTVFPLISSKSIPYSDCSKTFEVSNVGLSWSF